MENKCEKAGLAHAWREGQAMWGFELQTTNECANCGLKRTKHYESNEWWSYSDDRPNEKIVNIRPL